MKSIRDWVFSQIVSTSLVSSRPLTESGSFYNEGTPEAEINSQSSSRSADLVVPLAHHDASLILNSNPENQPHSAPQQVPLENSDELHAAEKNKKDALAKIEDLQIKFLRLVQRFGKSEDNLLAAKVLYRIHLATLVRAGESDLSRVNLRSDKLRAVAREHELTGLPELDFSLRILVLGKTGVGKSATINSILGHPKTEINAFQPSTDRIQEIVGTVDGIRITFIDTPGFIPTCTSNVGRNRRNLISIKRFIKKSPPDFVLYFERLDLINMHYNDFPLLQLMTEVFGKAIWFNTILVMTHSSSAIPEGPNGYPLNYESYVGQRADLLQHYIHQTVFDTKLENQVLLAENHPQCKRNPTGESILPNGQVWKSRFLLLCISTKVLGDANTLLEFRDSIELGESARTRSPSMPHLLSSFLRHRSFSSSVEAENEIDHIFRSEMEEDDEYDQLPTIRILTKSQFAKLLKSQKKAYLDELDYRETLFLKKQLKEECRKRQENKVLKEKESPEHNDDISDDNTSQEAVPLPDMTIPPSFDSDSPVHRYRCLVTNDQWLVRPVLDPQGWDHDVGFDGINLDTTVEIKNNIFASVAGQVSKEKQTFSIQSQCAAAYADPRGLMYSVGLDVQSSGDDMIYTTHGNTKLTNLKCNVTECGVSLTSFGKKFYTGVKIEDTLLVGKRFKMMMNVGQIKGAGQAAAYGGNLEATLRGSNYPVRNDHVSLTATALSYNKEMVLGGGFQSEFQPFRGVKVSVNANLNNRKMGQICIKTSSSEHLEVALVAAFSILKVLLRRKQTDNRSKQAVEQI